MQVGGPDGVFVGVLVGMSVGVLVGVLVGTLVGVFVGVFVGVLVGVFMGVLVGGADESTRLPAGLAPNRVTPMDWKRIADAVQQLMGEGKHHKFV